MEIKPAVSPLKPDVGMLDSLGSKQNTKSICKDTNASSLAGLLDSLGSKESAKNLSKGLIPVENEHASIPQEKKEAKISKSPLKRERDSFAFDSVHESKKKI